MMNTHSLGELAELMTDEKTGVPFVRQPDGKESCFFVGQNSFIL